MIGPSWDPYWESEPIWLTQLPPESLHPTADANRCRDTQLNHRQKSGNPGQVAEEELQEKGYEQQKKATEPTTMGS